MYRISALLLSFTFSVLCFAQKALDDIRLVPEKSGGVYYAYPAPTLKQTPPPHGYKPFYISHYGRHGSRYLINDKDYSGLLRLLQKADEMNALTAVGKEALGKMEMVWKEAENHGGDLAPLGKRQHQEIAERMFRSFPQVFKGKARISASSTTSTRCIKSMMAFCGKLKELNPKLTIDSDTLKKRSSHSTHHHSRHEKTKRDSDILQKNHNDFCSRKIDTQRFASQIISDSTFYSQAHTSADKLFYSFFDVAIDLQDMETDASFFDLFTSEELFECWRNGNSWFYLNSADSPLNEGKAAESSQSLIEDIIAEADRAIQGKGDAATLRFGHDGNIIPLAATLHLKDCDARETDHDSIDAKWQTYRVSPMAANIQLIFFRRKGSDDIIVKFLHNEEETSIPVESDILPYYHWKDVKDFLDN